MTTTSRQHRSDCAFGSGFFRVELLDSTPRYCQNEAEVQWVLRLLPRRAVSRIARDGYCLDPEDHPALMGDASTPDVVDAEWWLGLTQAEGMRELGLHTEADYARAYRMVEAAVARRENRAGQTGVHASIVIKRPGAGVTDV